jgi:hypothetical protein
MHKCKFPKKQVSIFKGRDNTKKSNMTPFTQFLSGLPFTDLLLVKDKSQTRHFSNKIEVSLYLLEANMDGKLWL